MSHDAAVTMTAADTSDPRAGLAAVATLRRMTEILELRQVEAALGAGLSWVDIAESLGVSRQAVHKKYRRRVPSELAPTRGGAR